MESYEVIRRAVDRVGAKLVASALNVSTSLVYKWCEPPSEAEGDGNSGARNPLDRVVAMMDCTGSRELTAWVCERADGFFVRNLRSSENMAKQEFLAHTQRMIRDFSELLRAMSDSMADSTIDHEEGQRIRHEWEDLKRFGEAFIASLEQAR